MNDAKEKIGMHDFLMELEDIQYNQYKYERLHSLISILQMFVAEVAEVTNAPADSLTDALYEIELEMGKNNERLVKLYRQKGKLA